MCSLVNKNLPLLRIDFNKFKRLEPREKNLESEALWGYVKDKQSKSIGTEKEIE